MGKKSKSCEDKLLTIKIKAVNRKTNLDVEDSMLVQCLDLPPFVGNMGPGFFRRGGKSTG